MHYNPKDADATLLPEEWYDASIAAAEEKVSKARNDMLVVSFTVFAPVGRTDIQRYYVNNPAGLSGLRKLCRAVGLSEEFDKGEITPELLLNRNLRVQVKIQRDERGQYDDKNVIAQVAPPVKAASSPPEAQPEPDYGPPPADSDIPFSFVAWIGLALTVASWTSSVSSVV